MNIEVLRNTLYKAYLDDFASLCSELGGTTKEVMGDLLAFEADRRALNITLNSIGTELTRDDRRRLYANFGLLHPNGGTRGLGVWGTLFFWWHGKGLCGVYIWRGTRLHRLSSQIASMPCCRDHHSILTLHKSTWVPFV